MADPACPDSGVVERYGELGAQVISPGASVFRRRTKYNAVKSASAHFGPRLFDSKAERDRADDLRLLEQAGEISALQLQPKVALTAGINWRLDFTYIERGRPVWEDVKGVMGRDTALKVKLWKQYGPGLLRITKRDGRKRAFVVVREVMAHPMEG